MKLLLSLSLLATLSFSSFTVAEIINVDCPGGRISGTRIDDSNGIQFSDDGVTQPKIDYVIDTDEPENSQVKYGDNAQPVYLLQHNESATTIAYIFSGVPYMDTIFPNGLVYSAEHKSFPARTALSWHYQCKLSR